MKQLRIIVAVALTISFIGVLSIFQKKSHDARQPSLDRAGTPLFGNLDIDSSLQLHLTKTQYYIQKFQQPGVYDVVIGGDSRTATAIAPHVMERLLPSKKIFNFGFGALTWTPAYLEKLAGLLRPDGSQKTLILVFSPLNLTEYNIKDSHFLEIARMPPDERDRYLRMKPEFTLFDPIFNEDSEDKILYYFSDGWNPVERGFTRKMATFFKRKYHGVKISEPIVANVLEAVANWTKNRIRVVGMRSPTSQDMAQLENQTLGFNESDFSEKFKIAGGKWLSFDGDAYNSNDGHHLSPLGAIEFSKALAKKIKELP